MFHPRVISGRHPFARPALPGVNARMDGSDFHATPPTSSLLTCSRVPASSGPMRGSPWLPHALDVRLDTASDPGEYPHRTPYRDPDCGLPGGQTRRHSPTINFSGLNTFKVGSTRYLCTSPAFVPTHRCVCYQPHRKARYWARGARLPRRDSHPLEHAALPGRTVPGFQIPLPAGTLG